MASLPSQPMPRGLGAPLILIVTACRAPEPSHCGKAARDKAAAAERVAVESSNAGRTEQRGYEAEIHRIRAEILLKRDPASTAAAEQSLQAAIAIAQSQKARSFELRAALSLAKLYHAADRDADAHAVLAPAVEGFPPT